MSRVHDELARIKANAERFISIEQIFETLSKRHEDTSLSDLAILLRIELSKSNISLKYLATDFSIHKAERYNNFFISFSNGINNLQPPLLNSVLDNIIKNNELYTPYQFGEKVFDNTNHGLLKKELVKALQNTILDLSDDFPEIAQEIAAENKNKQITSQSQNIDTKADTNPNDLVSNHDNLEFENNRLKADNHNLTEQLAKAQKQIEDLQNQIPILLGKYRKDDPLLLAIQIRNKEWANYDERNKRTRPTQDAIIAELKEIHNVGTDQLARAIELVSCPIDRSK